MKSMSAKMTHVALVVMNLDEALQFYTKKVGFDKKADHNPPAGERWVSVGPKGQDLELITGGQVRRKQLIHAHHNDRRRLQESFCGAQDPRCSIRAGTIEAPIENICNIHRPRLELIPDQPIPSSKKFLIGENRARQLTLLMHALKYESL